MKFTDLEEALEKSQWSITDLLPLLLDIDLKDGTINVTPTRFRNEMQLSTEERLQKLNQPRRKISKGLRSFKVTPDIVIFQNFKPGITYTVPLKILNIHETSTTIKIIMPPSAYFSSNGSGMSTKIAPGLNLQIEVSFVADSLRDFNHNITFYTKDENFDIKLIAIGPRPLLDIPDSIQLPNTAIDIQTERTIIVRNLGLVPANFSAITKKPFLVKPSKAVVLPDEIIQLTIYFKSTRLGKVEGKLKIQYETGETLSVNLVATTEEADVVVSTTNIAFHDTYLGLTTNSLIEIKNNSPYNINYKWKQFEFPQQEEMGKEYFLSKYEDMEFYEVSRNNVLLAKDVTDDPINLIVSDRILKDESAELEKEDLYKFSDVNFILNPRNSEMWPKSKLDVTVAFVPISVGDFEATAYIQITGLQKRLPVKFSGKCIGPKIELNTEEINGENIYVRAVHRYEVIFINSGPIPATIKYLQKPSQFGGSFNCDKKSFQLLSNTKSRAFIEVTSENRGKFIEEIVFQIQESNEILKLSMIGNIVCPLLNFDSTELDFGDVPLGYPITQEIGITNTSQVGIAFNVSVPEDGDSHSFTVAEYAAMTSKEDPLESPNEFIFEPSSGEVPPYAHHTIKVTLTSNKYRAFIGSLTLFMWGTRQNNRSIPLKYNACIPKIVCSEPKIEMKSMFIIQEYFRILLLENKSIFPGYFLITCESNDEALELSLDKTESYINPNEVVELKVVLKTDVVGTMSGSVSIKILGTQDFEKISEITTNSRGPCVDINVDSMHLGQIPTLILIKTPIEIDNDSSIPADIKLTTSGEFIWLEEGELHLNPEERSIFYLHTFGTYAGPFKSYVTVNVENGDVDTYPVTGVCVGFSILCEPSLAPFYEIGIVLTEQQFSHSVKITNMGKELHTLLITKNKVIRKLKIIEEPASIFQITPAQFDLAPGEFTVVYIEGFSKEPKEIEETFYIHAQIERRVTLQTLFTFAIHVEFQEPKACCSKSYMEFRKDVGFDYCIEVLEDTCILQNSTDANLNLYITIDQPFYFIIDEEFVTNMSLILREAEERCFLIRFEPIIHDRRCFSSYGTLNIYYKDHPKIDRIRLLGKVHFPDVVFYPNNVNFGSLPSNQSTYHYILMKNVSPIALNYYFTWLQNAYFIEAIDTIKSINFAVSSKHSVINTLEHAKIEFLSDIQEDTYEDKELKHSMRQILFPLITSATKEHKEFETIYEKITEQREYENIYEVIDLIPSSGHLAPYECQIVSVSINPPKQTLLEARVECHVIGGETESINIFAKSSKIMYHLEENVFDLGIILFNVMCSKKFLLENVGHTEFNYRLNYQNVGIAFQPIPGWMCVEPTFGVAPAMDGVNFTINYFPGAVGIFQETVEIEIEYENTLQVLIKGCAVQPQIYFNLPRPSFDTKEIIYLSYLAIAEIDYPQHSKSRGSMHPVNKMEIIEHLAKQGWEVIDAPETWPSKIDIQMAIERKLVGNFFKNNPSVLYEVYFKHPWCIPHLTMPPYVIDFGYVIADTIVERQLASFNYNPFSPRLVWSKLTRQQLDQGFNLTSPSRTNTFLIFKPTNKIFKTDNQGIQFSIYAMVGGGPKLEFYVKAIVTVPTASFQQSEIDFGEVQCGQCLLKQIVVTNRGFVPSTYKASLIWPPKTKAAFNLFRISDVEGTLAPGQDNYLNIYFEPKFSGQFQWELRLAIESNTEEIILPLKGIGIMPQIMLSEKRIVFAPTLPYSINKKFFTLKNISDFPVEVVFADFDGAADFENNVILTILKYYGVKRIYTPPQPPGEPFNKELIELYNSLIDYLREILIKEETEEIAKMIAKKRKSLKAKNKGDTPSKESSIDKNVDKVSEMFSVSQEESTIKDHGSISSSARFDVSSDNTLKHNKKEKKNTKQKKQSKSEDKVNNTKNVGLEDIPIENCMAKFSEGYDPLLGKNYDEIQQLIDTHITDLQQMEPTIDINISNRFALELLETQIKKDSHLNKVKSGLMLIFHGGPETKHLLLANNAALQLDLPALSVDRLIIDCLVNRCTLAAIKVREVIENRFLEIAGHADFQESPDIDEYDELEMKIDLIINVKPQNITPNQKVAAKEKKKENTKSKSSSKSDKAKKSTETLLDIPYTLFYEILGYMLSKFNRGFVIESLNSIFIRNSETLLLGLLKEMGYLRYILLIYLSYTYKEHLNHKLVLKQAETTLKANDIRIRQIAEMEYDDYNALPPTDKELYKQYLAQKRKKSLDKSISSLPKDRTLSPVKHEHIKEERGLSIISNKTGKTIKETLNPNEKLIKDTFEQGELRGYRIMFILENWDRKANALLKPPPDVLPVFNTKTLKPKAGITKAEPQMHKSPVKSLIDLEREQLGIPCWVINNAYPNKGHITEFIMAGLEDNEELQMALDEIEENVQSKLKEANKKFKVISFSPTRNKRSNTSDFFTLINISKSDLTSEDRKEILSSSNSESTVITRTKSSLVSSPTSQKLEMHKDGGRSSLIMRPGEKVSFRVVFAPTEFGNYTHTYFLELSATSKCYTIKIEGKADMPKIYMDPAMMFPQKKPNVMGLRVTASRSMLTTLNSKIYSFGPILVQGKNNRNNCLIGEENFNLISNSYLPCHIHIDFLEPTENFSLSINQLSILPNTSEFLPISFHPENLGTMSAKIVFTIQNHPKIETVELVGVGVELDVEIVPKVVVFERMILNIPAKRNLTVKNKGLLPIFWILVDEEAAFKTFVPSLRKGFMKAASQYILQFDFVPNEVVEKIEKTFKVLFYDQNFKCHEPLLTETIQIKAEVIDIIIDYHPEIELNEIKLGTQVVHTYTILNKSKYDLRFQDEIIFVKNEPQSDVEIKQCFDIKPNEGTLKINQPFEIRITFTPKKSGTLTKFSVFQFTLLDPIEDIELYKFQVKVSCKVCSSSYKLCPPVECNFGHQLINTENSKDIIIKNTGRYSFSFVIASYRILKEQKKRIMNKVSIAISRKGFKGKGKDKAAKKSIKTGSTKTKTDKSKKSGTSRKSRKSKKSSKSSFTTDSKKVTSLTEGIFTLTPSSGILPAKSDLTINVSCKPVKEASFEETVVFFISDAPKNINMGRKFTLKVKGSIPSIDVENFNEIFNEILVVNSAEDFICKAQEFQPYFIILEKLLCFNKTCLNTTNLVRIKIKNNAFIKADVNVKVIEGEPIFAVNHNKIHIEAYEFNYVTISFTPNSIQSFQGVLRIDISASNILVINLLGDGHLPEVTLIEPEANHNEEYSISFNPIMVESTASKQIIFKNSGVLACKVLIGVLDDDDHVLTLIPKEFPKNLAQLCSEECLYKEFSHTLVAEMKPSDEFNVELKFKPRSQIRLKCGITILTINNPYEVIKISVLAESYKEDVLLEDLDTVPTFKLEQNSSYELSRLYSNIPRPFYDLNYGHQFINRLHKKCFKIKNLSAEDTYRFVFPNFENLIFIPAVGHLKPNACKDIIVTFFSKETVNYDKVLLECRLVKILYLAAEHELISWDERQHLTVWKSASESDSDIIDTDNQRSEQEGSTSTNKMKFLTERGEPPITEIKNTGTTLYIYFSIVLDFCSYNCEVDEIIVDDTLIYEKKKNNFTVKNTSLLPLPISWTLSTHEDFPQRVYRGDYGFSNSSSVAGRRPQTANRPQNLFGNEKFWDPTVRPKSSQSSLFSSTCSMQSGDTWSELDMPFTIIPKNITIAPQSVQVFEVCFSPFDVYFYAAHAKSEIPNLKPDMKPLYILIKAKSLLPLYHFNIEPSDYITNRRDGREICGESVNENTKVVEFESLGIGLKNTKKFLILNPTGEDFNFRWEKTINNNELSLFECLTPKGHVSRGQSAEAAFTFITNKAGVFETIYMFFIERYNLTTKFLLVGRAREPCVFFENSGINLKPTILNVAVEGQVILKNTEDVSLKYIFKKISLYTESRDRKIKVHPFTGVLKPKSEEVVRIKFNPIQVGEASFNLLCQVENMEKPLKLRVNATCFEVQCIVKHVTELHSYDLDPNEVNVIEMTSLMLQKTSNVTFSIYNVGKIGFYYKWDIIDKYNLEYMKLTLNETEGYIKSNTFVTSVIKLKPIKILAKKKFQLQIKIPYGPTYDLHLVSTTCRSKYKVSFKEYDFGPCIIQKQKCDNHMVTLEVTNNDIFPALIEPQELPEEHLTYFIKNPTIPPKKAAKIVFFFHPLEAKYYSTEFCFSIQERLQKIVLKGEGVPLIIELVDAKNKFLHLGAIPVGKTVKKRLGVINKSKCSVDVIIDLIKRLPISTNVYRSLHKTSFEFPEVKASTAIVDTKYSELVSSGRSKEKKGKDKKGKEKKGKKEAASLKSDKSSKKSAKKSKKDKAKSKGSSEKSSKKRKSERLSSEKDSKKRKSERLSKIGKRSSKQQMEIERNREEAKARALEEAQMELVYSSIRVHPAKWTTIRPGQIYEFNLCYLPHKRMPLFTNEIFYQVEDEVNPLCIFKGSCIASDYYLDPDKVSFGTVIKGYSCECVVKLYNTGDIGGRYRWSSGRKDNQFSITPSEGYISPNMSVNFTLKYAPTKVQCFVKGTARCQIENVPSPLLVEMEGTCIHLPTPKEEIKFLCAVREEVSKEITIHNPSGVPWNITPLVSGIYFHIHDNIVVEPQSKLQLNVFYRPLSMTKPKKLHEGTLFIPLADGQGILYAITGEAKHPKPLKIIEKTIPSKTNHTILMSIPNWLPKVQQFSVLNCIDQTVHPILLYKLTGNNLVQVPALEEREYKWTIYCIHEGRLEFRVKFLNEATGEYVLYLVHLTITKCESLDEIRLKACARQTAEYKLKLENPIKHSALFSIISSTSDLHFKTPVYLKPYSETDIVIKYKPLLPSPESIAKLEITTETLGSFLYTFILSSAPAVPEAPIYLEAQLGQTAQKTVILSNITDVSGEFMSEIDDPLFTLIKPVSVVAKGKGSILIGFEPNNLGGYQSRLTLSSSTLGQFIYPLIGKCTIPKPQGPFIIKEGAFTGIPFSSPYLKPTVFNFVVEPASFTLKFTSEVLKPNSQIQILVGLAISLEDTDYPLTGKLTVTSADEDLYDIKWVFYLKSSK